MKEELKHLITALRITEQLPPRHPIKDREINNFFGEISKLGIDIDPPRHSGNIKYREFYIRNEEDFEVSVKVIQTDTSDMIFITADFGDED